SSTAPTPTGSVTLTLDGGQAQTATLVNGQASFTVTGPDVTHNPHTLAASYTPANNNYAASSASTTVNSNQSTTSVAVSAPAVTYNANGVVTVTVSSADGTPSGNVTLSVDGGAAQSATLNASGQATFTLTSPTAGNHTLHAVYAAQGNFAGSSADATLHVDQAA